MRADIGTGERREKRLAHETPDHREPVAHGLHERGHHVVAVDIEAVSDGRTIRAGQAVRHVVRGEKGGGPRCHAGVLAFAIRILGS